MAKKDSAVDETAVDKFYTEEDFANDFQAGEAIEYQFEPMMNTNKVGSTILIEFIQDNKREFETKMGGARHEVLVRFYDLETKKWGEKVKTGFPKQVYEKVVTNDIEVGKKYMIKLAEKKDLGGGKTWNVFTIKPVHNK